MEKEKNSKKTLNNKIRLFLFGKEGPLENRLKLTIIGAVALLSMVPISTYIEKRVDINRACFEADYQPRKNVIRVNRNDLNGDACNDLVLSLRDGSKRVYLGDGTYRIGMGTYQLVGEYNLNE